ncbi:MAG: glutamine--fructose-6-phosphate transaminase (isomerizing) [bacterium]
MCGIFGYIGKDDAKKVVLSGLKRLEYRGYDSWGVSVEKDGEVFLEKVVGKIDEKSPLDSLPYSNIAIGHTRWATHGGVTQLNAHPHFSSDKSFSLAQNGIVENYQELKSSLLEKGYSFISETDTEVIVRLIEENNKTSNSLFASIMHTFAELKGRNTIIVLSNKNEIIAARNGSPLVIGTNPERSEFYLSSDTLSFSPCAEFMYVMKNNEIVHIVDGTLNLYSAETGLKIDFTFEKIDIINDKIDKEGYDHFMLKEIVEQKHTIREAVQYSEEELKPLVDAIKNADKIYTIGAGTASFAAAQIAYYLRKISGKIAIELKSYECGSYKEIFSEKDLILAVSQSGETADTIEALEHAKNKGAKIASIVNMYGSSISRMSDYVYYSRSGPEICVASTKAFTSQISWGLLLAYSFLGRYSDAKNSIENLSDELETYFTEDTFSNIKNIVDKLINKEHFFVLGKGQNFNISLEGALKIKEITYKHFEGFAAGELKHGVIALIESGTPVFVIVSDDEDKADMISSAAQIKARGGYVIGVGKNNTLFDDFINTIQDGITDPIANVIPFQLISYYLGIKLGYDPDRPRNLAKSVTVK